MAGQVSKPRFVATASSVGRLKSHLRTERLWLPLLLSLYALLALAYSLLMPMWEAPDETAHYLVVLAVARDGQMPTAEESYEAVQPPGYYWLAGAFFRALAAIDPSLIAPYRPPLSPLESLTRYEWTDATYRFLPGAQLLRWLNIPLGALALWFIYRGATCFVEHASSLFPAVRPDPPDGRRRQDACATAPSQARGAGYIPLATLAFAALLPQFAYNSASISNDALANLSGAFLFWQLGVLATAQVTGRRLALLTAVALALPVLVKLTILPMSLAALLLVAWQIRRYYRRWALASLVGALAFFSLALALLWWQSPTSTDYLWRTVWWRLTTVRPLSEGSWSLWHIARFYTTSFWGQVGWEDTGLPGVVVFLLTGLALTGWLASLRLLFSSHSRRWQPDRHAWRVLWLAGALALLIVLRNLLVTPQYQARFLFPSLGALALLMVAGWYTLLPRRLASSLPHLIVTILLGANLLLFVTQVLPVFYQPFLD